MKRRIATIDFMRFVFSVIIVIYHARVGLFVGGYIAVEFSLL